MTRRLLHIPTARIHFRKDLTEDMFRYYVESMEWISDSSVYGFFQFGGRGHEGAWKFKEYEFMWIEDEEI